MSCPSIRAWDEQQGGGAALAVASVSTLRCPGGRLDHRDPTQCSTRRQPPPPPAPALPARPQEHLLDCHRCSEPPLSSWGRRPGLTTQTLPVCSQNFSQGPHLLPDPISTGPTPRTAVAAPFYLAPDRSPEWAGWAQPAWTLPSSFQRALTLHGVSLLRFLNDHKTELQVQGAVKLQGSVQKHGPQPGPRRRHLQSACSPSGSGTAAPLPARRDFMRGGGGGRQEE